MPHRLATLIKNVKASKNYGNVIDALNFTVEEVKERLQVCQLRWNRERNECIYTMDIKNIRGRGQFVRFHAENGVPGVTAFVGEEGTQHFDSEYHDDIDDVDEKVNLEEVLYLYFSLKLFNYFMHLK